MQKNSPILKIMKVILIAIAMLVSIVSGRAQGLLSQNLNTGQVIYGDFSLTAATDLTLSVNTSSQLIEANRGITSYAQPAQPQLPTTPITDPSSGFQPQLASSFTIQAVPEPSSIALGSLTLGLIAIARVIRKNRLAALN